MPQLSPFAVQSSLFSFIRPVGMEEAPQQGVERVVFPIAHSSDWLAMELAALGVTVTPLKRDDPKEPKQSWFSRTPWVAIEDSVFHLATVRQPRWRLGTGNRRLSVGKMTVQNIEPIEYHFVVPRPVGTFPPHYRAELRQGQSQWQGAGLAARLNKQKPLLDQLQAGFTSRRDRVVIEPDLDLDAVRVIFKTMAEAGVLTIVRDKTLHKSGFPDADLYRLIETVGDKVLHSTPGVRRP